VTTERRFCPTALGLVHYVVAGPPDGLPVVLLHQTPRSCDEFAEVLALLASAHRVLAIDTIGYGCSDRVATQPSMADYANGVRDVLDHANLPAATLVGHHTGAFIALEVAASYPARVSALVLSGPVFMDDAARAVLAPWFVQWHPSADGQHLHDKWSRLGRWISDPSLRQRLLADVFRAGETSEQGHLAILDYPMADRLPLIRARVLLLYGRQDPFAHIAQSQRFAALLPATTAVELDGGVFLPTEHPAAYAHAVREFVRALSPTP